MINKSLKSDLKQILANPSNIVKIEKGDVSNFSIEIELKEPETQCSYIYYNRETIRDLDFKELEELILTTQRIFFLKIF